MPRPPENFGRKVQAFWSRVSIGEPDVCWVYRGRQYLRNGYPSVRLDGHGYTAHRLAWFLERGPIDSGLFVCHRCDNRNCVNPNHLFLGTQQENLLDCVAKGRLPRAKLDPVKVREMRRLSAGGANRSVLSQMFGVSRSAVSNAVNGKRWAFVT
jgi:hypothetical protein